MLKSYITSLLLYLLFDYSDGVGPNRWYQINSGAPEKNIMLQKDQVMHILQYDAPIELGITASIE